MAATNAVEDLGVSKGVQTAMLGEKGDSSSHKGGSTSRLPTSNLQQRIDEELPDRGRECCDLRSRWSLYAPYGALL